MSFFSSHSPEPPSLPPPPEPAKIEKKAKKKVRKGVPSTILTSPLGIREEATTTKTILGV